MSILKEFTNKYEGIFNAESPVKGHGGEKTYHDLVEKGKVNYKGTEIEFWWNGQGGDPLRIASKIDESLKGTLTIYPRNYWGKLFSTLTPNWKYSFSKNIHSQYQFRGGNHLIKSIRNNQSLLELLDEANVCIVLKKDTGRITLTPVKGFSTLEHLETFAELVHLVGKSLKQRITY